MNTEARRMIGWVVGVLDRLDIIIGTAERATVSLCVVENKAMIKQIMLLRASFSEQARCPRPLLCMPAHSSLRVTDSWHI